MNGSSLINKLGPLQDRRPHFKNSKETFVPSSYSKRRLGDQPFSN